MKSRGGGEYLPLLQCHALSPFAECLPSGSLKQLIKGFFSLTCFPSTFFHLNWWNSFLVVAFLPLPPCPSSPCCHPVITFQLLYLFCLHIPQLAWPSFYSSSITFQILLLHSLHLLLSYLVSGRVFPSFSLDKLLSRSCISPEAFILQQWETHKSRANVWCQGLAIF